MSKSKANNEKSSGPMDSKREIADSNDPKTDQDFPGYPHYPAKDDILNQKGLKKLSTDDENFTRSGAYMKDGKPQPAGDKLRGELENDLDIVPGTEADVTKDDLIALNDERGNKSAGEDLDIPGAELDDDNEAIGEEDEENNYYSLGSDKEDNLEDSRS